MKIIPKVAFAAIVLAGVSAPAVSSAQACDKTCLTTAVVEFKRALIAGKPQAVAPGTEIRQNMDPATLGELAWKDVKAIRSSMVFTDPMTGDVVSRDGVELKDGKPAYLSTHLRIKDGKISLVEMSADTRNAKAGYVWSLPTMFEQVVPPGLRMTRDQMEAIGRRYFQALTDHKPVKADFDDAKCNRYHSGQQVTNVALNDVEGAGVRTCTSSVEGAPPWGPAVEQVFPVIDTEHGVVFGETLLMYPDQVMYVSEIFKIEQGKITNIDNIGIVQPGRDHTTGFNRK